MPQTSYEEIGRRAAFLSAKASFCGNVIRTGMTLDSARGNVEDLIAALDAGLAAV